LSPGLAIWAVRYSQCSKWPIAKIDPNFYSYLLNSFVLYLIWAALYYFIIFQLTYDRCERKNNTTLFRYHLENKSSLFYQISGIFGEKIRPFAFMSMHMLFSLVTIIVTYLTLYSEFLQLGLISFSILQTFWTAANYYMEIFSKNYEIRINQLEKIKGSLIDNKKIK
jgi:hypothetical protein